jgi:hypothetical protein
MMAHDPTAIGIRVIDPTLAPRDGVWTEVLEAARRWRAEGAPVKVIVDMLADDYGVPLEPETVCRLLNITADGLAIRH